MRLSLAGGLTQFGVNLMTIRPGAWSSQRHWHEKEDELVYMLSGELVLVEDGGETIMRAGDSAAWKAGVRNGHHFVNRTSNDAVFLVVGTKDPTDWGEYSDIDMVFHREDSPGLKGGGFTHKDGTKY